MVSLVHTMFNAYGIPKALIMHVVGNDIGAWSTKELLYRMKFALYVIKNMLPGCTLIFSSMLPRSSWRYSLNGNGNRNRNRVNRGVRSYLLKIGGMFSNI